MPASSGLCCILAVIKTGDTAEGNFRHKTEGWWASGTSSFLGKGSIPRVPSSLCGEEEGPQGCTKLSSSRSYMRNLTI